MIYILYYIFSLLEHFGKNLKKMHLIYISDPYVIYSLVCSIHLICIYIRPVYDIYSIYWYVLFFSLFRAIFHDFLNFRIWFFVCLFFHVFFFSCVSFFFSLILLCCVWQFCSDNTCIHNAGSPLTVFKVPAAWAVRPKSTEPMTATLAALLAWAELLSLSWGLQQTQLDGEFAWQTQNTVSPQRVHRERES